MVQTSHSKIRRDQISLCFRSTHIYFSAVIFEYSDSDKSDTWYVRWCHKSSADIKIQSAARREGFFANFKLSWQKRQLGDRGDQKGKRGRGF